MKDCDEKQIIRLLSDELVSSKDHIEALNNLNKIHSSIINSKDKRNLIKLFLQELNSRTSFYINSKSMIFSGSSIKFNKILYYKEEESYVALIGYFMGALKDYPTIKDYTNQYNVVVDFISSYSTPTISDYDILTKEEIDKIFNLPLVKKAMDVITKDRPLSIFNFNLVNESSNSTYLRYINTIIHSRFKHEEGYGNETITVFIHELGHALHYAITKDISVIPELFKELFEASFNNDWINVPECDQPEIFADFFAVASSFETIYEERNNIIKLLPRNATKTINDYFQFLLEEHNHN